MIKTFKSRSLRRLFLKGQVKGISASLYDRLVLVLDQLDAATMPEDMNIPGNDFHALRGKPKRYTVHINGNWFVTFEWDGQNAVRVDLEDYH